MDWESGELFDPFYPVTNLSKFCQKVYTSKMNGNTSFDHTLNCDVCTKLFKSHNQKGIRKTSFDLQADELHLGLTELNMSHMFIDYRFICKLGITIINNPMTISFV